MVVPLGNVCLKHFEIDVVEWKVAEAEPPEATGKAETAEPAEAASSALQVRRIQFFYFAGRVASSTSSEEARKHPSALYSKTSPILILHGRTTSWSELFWT